MRPKKANRNVITGIRSHRLAWKPGACGTTKGTPVMSIIGERGFPIGPAWCQLDADRLLWGVGVGARGRALGPGNGTPSVISIGEQAGFAP